MCIESGMARAKNTINVAVKNFVDFLIASISFWILGFALMFGASQSGWIGTDNFMLDVSNNKLVAFFVFQMVFCGTAATIVSGAISGRTKFGVYLAISLVVSSVIYPVYGHWAWGGLFSGESSGWLQKLGFIDFAGSTVVHSIGAWVALVAIYLIGPREGKFGPNGEVNKIRPHNLTLVYLGGLILIFGWFGFNCGSTLRADGSIAPIAMVTLLSCAAGGISSTFYSWFTSPDGHPEPEMMINGALAGLVAITAACAAVSSVSAVLIGLIAGIICPMSMRFIEQKLRLDDVVGAISVHGTCGVWGTLAAGIFAFDSALGENSRWTQIGVQLLGSFAALFWTTVVMSCVLYAIKKWNGLRVDAKSERIGLNVSEHGATSTLLDIAVNMNEAAGDGNFSSKMEVDVENGTEAGDIAIGFNNMLLRVRSALSESDKSKLDAIRHHREAEEQRKFAEEQTKLSLVSRDEAVEAEKLARKSKQEVVSATERHAEQLGLTVSQVQTLTDEIETTFSNINEATFTVGQKLNDFEKSTSDIGIVIAVVEDIARMSSILAVNAMIEAARAGRHGKSFEVVAHEMHKMASGTHRSSLKIKKVLESMNNMLNELVAGLSDQKVTIRDGKELSKRVESLLEELTHAKGESNIRSEDIAA